MYSLALCIALHHVLSSSAASKPNVVFIMADDMGFNDVGFHGGDVRTPNLDALAGHGIILNRHYTQPCCTPSRAALMTSKYPVTIGVQRAPLSAGVPGRLGIEEKLFPQYFKDLGYRTHLVGKWHIGYETWAHTPTRRGFDTFFGYYNGFIGYYNSVYNQLNSNGLFPGRDFRRNENHAWSETYGKYLTEELSKEAVKVIEAHEDDKGLLLFLNHMAPHKGTFGIFAEQPPNSTNISGRNILAEMVKRLDDSIGDVVEALNKKEILNNTIIVFISDNGGPTVDPFFFQQNFASNFPLRGTKMSVHDGGIRTPAVIWSSSLNSPRVSDQYFHITDWLPTLYSAAGGNLVNSSILDGVDQWNSLTNNVQGTREEILVDVDGYKETQAIIQGQWKLVKNYGQGSPSTLIDQYSGTSGRNSEYDPEEVENSVVGRILGRPEVYYDKVRSYATVDSECDNKGAAQSTECRNKYCLYNIKEDPTECRDLSGQYPALVSNLTARLEEYSSNGRPVGDSQFDPRSNTIFWGGYWSPWLSSA